MSEYMIWLVALYETDSSVLSSLEMINNILHPGAQG